MRRMLMLFVSGKHMPAVRVTWLVGEVRAAAGASARSQIVPVKDGTALITHTW